MDKLILVFFCKQKILTPILSSDHTLVFINRLPNVKRNNWSRKNDSANKWQGFGHDPYIKYGPRTFGKSFFFHLFTTIKF